jgi:hypothetical protein
MWSVIVGRSIYREVLLTVQLPLSKGRKYFTLLLKFEKSIGRTLLLSVLPGGHYPTILNPLLSSSKHTARHFSCRP